MLQFRHLGKSFGICLVQLQWKPLRLKSLLIQHDYFPCFQWSMKQAFGKRCRVLTSVSTENFYLPHMSFMNA